MSDQVDGNSAMSRRVKFSLPELKFDLVCDACNRPVFRISATAETMATDSFDLQCHGDGSHTITPSNRTMYKWVIR